MKKNDIAAVVLIVAIAGIISWFGAGALIGKPENNPVEIERMTVIEPNFPTPDPRIFNDKAIDPTVEIKDGGQSSQNPFGN